MRTSRLLRQIAGAVAFLTRMLTAAVIATASPESPIDNVIPLDHLHRHQTIVLKGDVFHVQGLDVDRDFIYVSSVDSVAHRGILQKFARSGALVQSVDLTDGARYHPGGMAIDGASLWIPVAEYRAASSTRIMQIDKASLQIVSSFIAPDHIGALMSHGGRLFGGNWDAERLYIWTQTGNSIASLPNPRHVAYQDIKFVDGQLVASGIASDHLTGAIDWLDPETFALRARWSVGRTSAGQLWTREGMTIADGQLYLSPEDGHDGLAEVHVFALSEIEAAAVAVSPPEALDATFAVAGLR